MCDQHRADFCGYSGNKFVRTPTLDSLAKDAVVFNNAYTPSPICVPARQCMMSGQLPKTCNCEGWIDLKPNYRTFAKEFSRYAYRTVCSGKLHHIGTDQMQGWVKRIAPDAEISDEYIENKIEKEFKKYQPCPGTGKWPNQREIEEARPAFGPYQAFDENAVSEAIYYLDRHFSDHLYLRPQSHRPLLFKLSLIQPHYPFFTSEEKFERYYNSVPIFVEKPCEHPILSLSQQNKPVNVSEEAIRRATATYYGMIETADEYFGKVIEKIKSLGENLDDWIIIYTSDHGEMLGQHGIWEKTRFYEASVKVPLFIRCPNRFKPRVVNQNVNLCDIFATLCDLAEIPIPENLDSRSLVQLMNGNTENWTNETISQLANCHLMIKWDSLKYQYYGEDIPEVLFDLEKDPGETANFTKEPAYSKITSKFRARLADLGFGPNAVTHYKNAGYSK